MNEEVLIPVFQEADYSLERWNKMAKSANMSYFTDKLGHVPSEEEYQELMFELEIELANQEIEEPELPIIYLKDGKPILNCDDEEQLAETRLSNSKMV